MITRSGNTGVTASVSFATADGSAFAGSDYSTTSGAASFAIGQSQISVAVPIQANARNEPQESFAFNLSGPIAGGGAVASVTGGSATGTISADPPLPTLAINSVTVSDRAEGVATLVVTRGGDLSAASRVQFSTAPGSAEAGSDFSARSVTIDFAINQAEARIEVPILANSTPLRLNNREGEESFTVTLSNPTDATITTGTGTVTISADPVIGPALFSVGDAAVREGRIAEIVVTRGGDLTAEVKVGYRTADGSAVAGQDYASQSGVLTFAPNETRKVITIQTARDRVVEGAEFFNVILASPDGGIINGDVGRVAIAPDPSLPTLVINDVGVSDTTPGTATLTVTMSEASEDTVTVAFATETGSADSGDFSGASGTLTFQPGETSKTIGIGIAANLSTEAAE